MPEIALLVPGLLHVILFAWLIVCAVQDKRQREVSNWLTMPPFLLGLLFALGQGGDTLVLTLITLVVFLAARTVWQAQGAADIKVLVALAAFWPAALYSALMGTAAWSAVRIVQGKGKEAYAGIPPIAVSALIVLAFDMFPVFHFLMI